MTSSRTMTLNMGPQHPSTHGVLRLVLTLDGEVVVKCVSHIGYLHTGIEKGLESKRYQQGIPLTDRMDYLAPLSNNLALVLAVALLLEAALLTLNFHSLAFEKARRLAYAAAAAGDAPRAEALLRPALESRLLRAPALEFLGRLNQGAGDKGFKAAVYYEMTLLENRYSAVSWRALRKIYSGPGLEAQARGLESRRAEAFK